MQTSLLMKKTTLIVLTLLMLNGCTFFRSPGKDDCDKILPREKLTDILTEMYLLEGYFIELQAFNPGLQDSLAHYYSGLFEKHGMSFTEFETALSCYLLHEDDIQQIHEEILQRYSIMESQIEPIKPEGLREDTPEVPDSVQDRHFR